MKHTKSNSKQFKDIEKKYPKVANKPALQFGKSLTKVMEIFNK